MYCDILRRVEGLGVDQYSIGKRYSLGFLLLCQSLFKFTKLVQRDLLFLVQNLQYHISPQHSQYHEVRLACSTPLTSGI